MQEWSNHLGEFEGRRVGEAVGGTGENNEPAARDEACGLLRPWLGNEEVAGPADDEYRS